MLTAANNHWNARRYGHEADFVSKFGASVLDMLEPAPGERILDLGCGDGTLAAHIAAAGAEVIGVDSAPEMIEAVRARGLQGQVMSGEALHFESEFDAVFSNAALHWMPQAERVLQGVHKALRPGGRFVAEMGGEGNIAHLRAAMRQVFMAHPEFGPLRLPWYFPAPEAYADLLRANGFDVLEIALIPRPTPLHAGMRAWLEMFANGIVSHLTPEQQQVFLRECEQQLRAYCYSKSEGWVADYVRLRFRAVKR